jgi:hypothetical protein
VISFFTVVHAVRRIDCVRAPAMTAAMARWATSLTVLVDSSQRSSGVFVARGSHNSSPNSPMVHNRQNIVVHWLGIATLVFIVARSWGFIQL